MTTRFVMTPASFGATHAAAGLRDFARAVAHIHTVHVSRRDLVEMEPRLLEDIGVSQRQALTEAGRSPWDIKPAAPQRRNGDGGAPACARPCAGGGLASGSASSTSMRCAISA
jgi:uncharacterized protein YjiS (DUF1127 family)